MGSQSNELVVRTVQAGPGGVIRQRFITLFNTLPTAIGQHIKGVAKTDAAQGQDFAAVFNGSPVVETGAPVQPGWVMSDAEGRAIQYDPTLGGTQYPAGLAEEAASGAGQFIEVFDPFRNLVNG